MRSALTTLGELIGALLVALGAGLAWLPAGLVVGGVLLAGLSYLAAEADG